MFDQVPPSHLLLGRRPEPIRSWAQWLDLWADAQHAPVMISLLHSGFDVPVEGFDSDRLYVQAQRVLFYLMAADCHWMVPEAFKTPEDRRVGPPGDTFWIGRQQVARKAFTVLCTQFFRAHAMPEVRQVMMQPDVMDALLEFFAPATDSSAFRIWNLGDQNAQRDVRRDQACEFLLAFCKLVLLGRWKTGNEQVDLRDRLPRVIPILIGLGQLHEVLQGKFYYSNLTTGCVTAMEEVAFRISDYPDLDAGQGRTMRRPLSVSEAIEYGTPAAKQAASMLVVLRTIGYAQTWSAYERRG